jgi:hypothetical protein
MTDATHPPPIVVRNCIFAHEVLRRIGFPSDDIYAATGNVVGVGRAAMVVLRHAGLEWRWTIDRLSMSDDDFRRAYEEAGEAWNSLPEDDDPWGFSGSEIDRMGAMAVRSIVEKGIPIPKRREGRAS